MGLPPDGPKAVTWGASITLTGDVVEVRQSRDIANYDSVTVNITQPFIFDVPNTRNLTKDLRVEIKLEIFDVDRPIKRLTP
jgi:hypothetical protein